MNNLLRCCVMAGFFFSFFSNKVLLFFIIFITEREQPERTERNFWLALIGSHGSLFVTFSLISFTRCSPSSGVIKLNFSSPDGFSRPPSPRWLTPNVIIKSPGSAPGPALCFIAAAQSYCSISLDGAQDFTGKTLVVVVVAPLKPFPRHFSDIIVR